MVVIWRPESAFEFSAALLQLLLSVLLQFLQDPRGLASFRLEIGCCGLGFGRIRQRRRRREVPDLRSGFDRVHRSRLLDGGRLDLDGRCPYCCNLRGGPGYFAELAGQVDSRGCLSRGSW